MEIRRGFYFSYMGFCERGLKSSCFLLDENKNAIHTEVAGLLPPLPKYTPLILEGGMEGDIFIISGIHIDEDEDAAEKFLTRNRACSPGCMEKIRKALPAGLWHADRSSSSALMDAGFSEGTALSIADLVCRVKDASLSVRFMTYAGFPFEAMDEFFKRGITYKELRGNVYSAGIKCDTPLPACDRAQFLLMSTAKRRGNPLAEFNENSKERYEYILRKALKNIEGEGHTYVSLPQFENALCRASWTGRAFKDPCYDLLTIYALNSPAIAVKDKKIYIRKYLDNEQGAIRSLMRIEGFLLPAVIPEKKTLRGFDEGQRAAVLGSLSNTVSIITGGPGTGKTTITKAIVDSCENAGLKVLLAAPTGRAASMLKSRTRHPASTIHRMLGFRGISPDRFIARFDEDCPLDGDVLIADESSMIDISVFDMMLRAVPDGCRLIFIGDADQLPSVSPGDILRNLIKSGRYPVFRLETTHRQIKGSSIIDNAKAVMRGNALNEGPDFEIRTFRNDGEILLDVLSEFKKSYSEKNVNSFQILSPVKEKTAGTEEINKAVMQHIRPENRARLAVGDKVMTTKNVYSPDPEYSYINGDVGTVKNISEGTAEIRLPGGDTVYVKDLSDIRHAWAVTIHKSQGSEYDTTAVVLPDCADRMLTRQLLYTAFTRSKKKVIVFCTEKTRKKAECAPDMQERNCGILDLLMLAQNQSSSPANPSS